MSFDIDVTDPRFAPATGVPVPNGLTLDHLAAMATALRTTGRVLATDIVEINPSLGADPNTATPGERMGPARRTTEAALHFLRYLLATTGASA